MPVTAAISMSISAIAIGERFESPGPVGKLWKPRRFAFGGLPECRSCRYHSEALRLMPCDRFLMSGTKHFTLVVVFLLAALRDRGPYPILVLNGEQGTAKSTFARIVRSLTDPSSVPLSSLPPSGRDLFIAANNSHVQSFDNISKLSIGCRITCACLQQAAGSAFGRCTQTQTKPFLIQLVRSCSMESVTSLLGAIFKIA